MEQALSLLISAGALGVSLITALYTMSAAPRPIMFINPRVDQTGDESAPYVGDIVTIFNDGRRAVFVRNFGQNRPDGSMQVHNRSMMSGVKFKNPDVPFVLEPGATVQFQIPKGLIPVKERDDRGYAMEWIETGIFGLHWKRKKVVKPSRPASETVASFSPVKTPRRDLREPRTYRD